MNLSMWRVPNLGSSLVCKMGFPPYPRGCPYSVGLVGGQWDTPISPRKVGAGGVCPCTCSRVTPEPQNGARLPVPDQGG